MLDAVVRLMADGTPFTELPVQQIAEAADVPRSTFYLHFPDKGQLLLALAGQPVQAMMAAWTDWADANRYEPLSMRLPVERILALYRSNLHMLAALHEVAAYDEEVAAFWHEQLQSVIDTHRDAIVAEQDAGHIHPEADAEQLALLIHSMLDRAISLHCLADPDGGGDAALALALARSLWLMIYGDAPRGEPDLSSG